MRVSDCMKAALELARDAEKSQEEAAPKEITAQVTVVNATVVTEI